MGVSHALGMSEIIHPNVGGMRFSTSRQTLLWIPDSFSLLCLAIALLADVRKREHCLSTEIQGFSVIRNYLRTKDNDLKSANIRTLRHEAGYYGITPPVKRLMPCGDLSQSSCGDTLFYGYLPSPNIPLQEAVSVTATISDVSVHGRPTSTISTPFRSEILPSAQAFTNSCNSPAQVTASNNYRVPQRGHPHSRTPSVDLKHTRNSSADLNKLFKKDIRLVFSPQTVSRWADSLKVQIIKAHHNWIVIAYAHFMTCYQLKDTSGWQHVFSSPHIESMIERVAINTKMGIGTDRKIVAISYDSQVRLWCVTEDGIKTDIGIFNLNVRIEYLFFIGSQLFTLSPTGKIRV